MTEVRDNPEKSRYELLEDNPEYADLTTAGGGAGAPPSGGGRGWGPVRGGEAARSMPEDGVSRP
jgi:hypothetical protein